VQALDCRHGLLQVAPILVLWGDPESLLAGPGLDTAAAPPFAGRSLPLLACEAELEVGGPPGRTP